MTHTETINIKEPARHLEQACDHLSALALALRTSTSVGSTVLTIKAIQHALNDVASAGAAFRDIEA
jgi:hypothetical protein